MGKSLHDVCAREPFVEVRSGWARVYYTYVCACMCISRSSVIGLMLNNTLVGISRSSRESITFSAVRVRAFHFFYRECVNKKKIRKVAAGERRSGASGALRSTGVCVCVCFSGQPFLRQQT